MSNAANVNASFVQRLISANSTNSTLVSAYPCYLTGLCLIDINASPAWLKLYNKATAPTVGTDTPVMTIEIPGNGVIENITFPDGGIYFDTGLGFGITTALADNSTSAVAANEVVINLFYKKG